MTTAWQQHHCKTTHPRDWRCLNVRGANKSTPQPLFSLFLFLVHLPVLEWTIPFILLIYIFFCIHGRKWCDVTSCVRAHYNYYLWSKLNKNSKNSCRFFPFLPSLNRAFVSLSFLFLFNKKKKTTFPQLDSRYWRIHWVHWGTNMYFLPALMWTL